MCRPVAIAGAIILVPYHVVKSLKLIWRSSGDAKMPLKFWRDWKDLNSGARLLRRRKSIEKTPYRNGVYRYGLGFGFLILTPNSIMCSGVQFTKSGWVIQIPQESCGSQINNTYKYNIRSWFLHMSRQLSYRDMCKIVTSLDNQKEN